MYNASMAKIRTLILLILLTCQQLSGQNIDLDAVKANDEFRWGVRAFHNGFYNKAILSLEKSLSLKPTLTLTRQWLGNALYKSGFEEAALKEWRYLIEAEGGNALLEHRLQILTFRRGLGRELSGDLSLHP